MRGSVATRTKVGLRAWQESVGGLGCGGDERLNIRIANNPVERDAVYRFRHRVYGVREGRNLGYTASNGRLLEQLDAGADLLAAFDEENTVHAAVRLEEFEAACVRRGFEFDGRPSGSGCRIDPASFSSALLVDPRKDPHLTIRLLASLVSVGVERGFQRDYCFPTTGDALLRARLGYRNSDVLTGGSRGGRILELVLPASRNSDPGSAVARPARWRSIRRRGSKRP